MLIERGLRAQLVTQSMITGVLAIQLDIMPEVPAVFKRHTEGGEIVEIPTAPSMQEKIGRIFKELQKRFFTSSHYSYSRLALRGPIQPSR